jgi:hypothetical protein
MTASPTTPSRQTVDSSPLNMLFDSAQPSMVIAPPMDMSRESTAELELLENSGLETVPMESLYDLTRLRTLSSTARCDPNSASLEEDFIAQGIVPIVEAEELFQRYIHGICPYLWAGMLFPYESLHAVRRNSTVLTAVVLTVAALHMPNHNDALKRCYGVFVSLTYNTCLARSGSLDDIRAQALGAFYLSNLSWKLSGLAVRTGVELNLHQSFRKLMRGQEDYRDNVRLWYALYVCEQQYSIAYGRPSTIHEDHAIRDIEQFLDTPTATPGDVRLAAQVSLFRILTEAYNTFGSDAGHPLMEDDLHQLQMFNLAIEEWRSCWQARSAANMETGSYSSKGIALYYQFARVHLNSLALRALPPLCAGSWDSLSYERHEAIRIAITAATGALTLVLEERDLRCAIPVVPVFTHTMFAFCATFLLNMAHILGSTVHVQSPLSSSAPSDLGLGVNITQILLLVRKSADFLADVTEDLNKKHLMNHILQGINELLDRVETTGTPASATTFLLDGSAEPDFLQMHTGAGTGSPFDIHSLNTLSFDFDDTFMKQVSSTNLDFWNADPMH